MYTRWLKDITNYTPVTYFKEHNIKIQDIFTNPVGECAFFQSDSGDIYDVGDTWHN